MTQLASLCEKYLLQDPPSLSRLVLADKYGLNKLSKVCMEFAKKTPVTTLKKEEMYNQVDPASKVEILEHHISDLDCGVIQYFMTARALSSSREMLESHKERFKQIYALANGNSDVFVQCRDGEGIHRQGEGYHCYYCKAYLLQRIKQQVPADQR